ncbi:SulP family inorganic anion transporter [Corynebacterium incognita]|uniref:SulP family inorganic anion transporter n=1 Tax=Corynebacterium incognita TaxID=2754725 RepID=A0A7G7CSQ5_9CORY|nr:SulP family inorganic anion transporter [Corynebacterium incognita]QNE90621.1 SulP family inorganic anion transporter [Corynebacterium incognita]
MSLSTVLRPQHNSDSLSVVSSFREAFSSPQRLRIEVLGGLAVALALIPEAIAFSIVANVDPAVGLYASALLAMVIALTGGRPAMISAATGAIALVVAPVAIQYGMDYLIATVLLGGVFQVLLGFIGVAKLQRFIPRSVMLGFVNALGILIFTAQLPHLVDVPWAVYPLVALGIAVMIFWPKFTTAVPAPLVTIVLVALVAIGSGAQVPQVSDMGQLPDSLPSFFVPDVPLTVETLRIIAPYSLGFAVVGLMESLMTAKLVDGITDTHSNKTRESIGQGIGNIVQSFFGGMGGCAMIGQTMINVKESGARTRLSTFVAGAALLAFLVFAGDVVGLIPMAALVGIMVMVSIGTVNWHSVHPRTLKLMPLSETITMLVTVIATLVTHNLAVGVILGVLTAMVMFARRVAHLVSVEKVVVGGQTATYRVTGQLFWASSNDLVYSFDYSDPSEHVVVDLTAAEIWDASTVATLDSIRHKYETRGATVEFIGLDGASKARLESLSGRLGEDG